jgi:hypothetical protein
MYNGWDIVAAALRIEAGADRRKYGRPNLSNPRDDWGRRSNQKKEPGSPTKSRAFLITH